jgi:hypothetical protein
MKMPQSQQTWLIAGVAAAFALVVLCACGIFGYQFVLKDDAEDVASDFLAAAQDKDASEARDLVCATMRGDIDDDFSDGDEEILSYSVVDSTEQSDTAQVDARVEVRDNGRTGSQDLVLSLVKEDGDWKVCGIRAR